MAYSKIIEFSSPLGEKGLRAALDMDPGWKTVDFGEKTVIVSAMDPSGAMLTDVTRKVFVVTGEFSNMKVAIERLADHSSADPRPARYRLTAVYPPQVQDDFAAGKKIDPGTLGALEVRLMALVIVAGGTIDMDAD